MRGQRSQVLMASAARSEQSSERRGVSPRLKVPTVGLLLLSQGTHVEPTVAATKKPPPGMIRKQRFLLMFMVGATGFEPATSATPLQRATKLRHAPTLFLLSSFVCEGCENEAYPSAFGGK